MTTLKEKIAVMQAYTDGKSIEFRRLRTDGWISCFIPIWNFSDYEYRVKPEPKTAFEIYVETAYPKSLNSQWAACTRDAVKLGLDAVIKAYKEGLIKE